MGADEHHGALKGGGGVADAVPAVSAPVVALPRGGGAVRGIGETFTANPATGTGTFAVPLGLTPGRSGFGPAFALSYDSGAGNGVFGLGWSMGLPQIARRTDRGVPRYVDDGPGADVFVLSGAEDLVPLAVPADERTVDGITYAVTRYRPRVESAFARIERWRASSGGTHWRTVDRHDVTTLYGTGVASRISDPADARRIFTWLVDESYDDRGNRIVYEYAAEDGAGIDPRLVHERNRGAVRGAQRHLTRVRYGNRVSRLVDADPAAADWMFEVVLDHGTPDTGGGWPVRPDPYSSYRAGFEVRTYRRCERVSMVHHFPDDPAVGRDCLVRSVELHYRDDPAISLLTGVTVAGHRHVEGGYRSTVMPTVTFDYSDGPLDRDIHLLDRDTVAGALDTRPRFVDLDGTGLAGALSGQAGAWWHASNDGGGRFGRAGPVDPAPAGVDPGSAQLADLAGNGLLDVVVHDGPAAGFYERAGGGWSTLTPLRAALGLPTRDPNLRFVDLTGDGLADVLVTEDDALVWYAGLGEEGYAIGGRVAQAIDEETGPRVVLADPSEAIALADLSGDGLADLVRVRPGEVCYWPNLGHGRFGAKVTMDDPPDLGPPDAFDPRRVRFVDIDGSGPTDLVHLTATGARLCRNLAGNRWGDPVDVDLPVPHDLADVDAIDLLGTGTGCLVWSSSLPGDAPDALRYLELTSGRKPHLLVGMDNGMGASTRLEYAPSTRSFLDDAAAGRPWATRLPFPVHVVERVERRDAVSGNRFVTRYRYHHGHFDGVEREFRGFGMVERTDAEERTAGSAPPVHVRTWYHAGAYLEGDSISARFATEYVRTGEPAALDTALLPDTVLPAGLSVDDEREACRALRGSVLREEVYGRDGSPSADLPYRVAERNHTVRVLQPRGVGPHAVVLVHPLESVELHDERTGDPRVTHELVLDVDDWGGVTRAASVAYGRWRPDPDPLLTEADRALQATTVVTMTGTTFTGAVEGADAHRAPLPCTSQVWEVLGIAPAEGRFGLAELRARLAEAAAAPPVPYTERGGAGPRLRLVEHVRTLYRGDALGDLLPHGELESRALPGETYRLAATDDLLAATLVRDGTALLPPDPAPLLADAGYVRVAGLDGWWIPTGRTYLHPDGPVPGEAEYAGERFYLPHRFVDAFGNATVVAYDAPHHLQVVRSEDALGNVTTARLDHRVLAPATVTDPNGCVSDAVYDGLGLLAASAVVGKEGDLLGDSVDGVDPDPTPEQVRVFVADPHGSAAALLGTATTRIVHDLGRHARCGQPALTAVLTREEHVRDAAVPRIRIAVVYSDGFGREVQTKAMAAPGPAPARAPDTVLPGGDVAPGAVLPGPPVAVEHRWVGTGRVEYDGKGDPRRRYEPFFAATHLCETEDEIVATGAAVESCRDALGRVVATLRPDGTYDKVVVGPWRQASWDAHDTLLLDAATDPDVTAVAGGLVAGASWYRTRIEGLPGADPADREAARTAARSAEPHAGTPTVAFADVLGRAFLTVADCGPGGPITARVERDVEGNELSVTDGNGVVVARTDHDVAGRPLHSVSPDAGERWMLPDAAGHPVRLWDGLGRTIATGYDALRRPTAVTVDGRCVERTVYGEAAGAAGNHRGRVHRVFDSAGVAVADAYDVAGTPVRTSRRLLADPDAVLDWPADAAARTALLDAETFSGAARHDALGRAVQVVAPHSDAPGTVVAVVRTRWSAANVPDRVDAWPEQPAEPAGLLDPATATQHVLTEVEHNARGQRTRIVHGNRVVTEQEFDPLTFRLRRIVTRRGADLLQHLTYDHDAVGNVVLVRDAAHDRLIHAGQVVPSGAEYRYDACYRLVAARGREHRGGDAQPGPDATAWTVPLLPNDGQALRSYVETYTYDAAGNLTAVRHHGSGTLDAPGGVVWHRRHQYALGSNRLIATSVPADADVLPAHAAAPGYTHRYTHDAHGNLTAMPHLAALEWDERDRLRWADLGGGGTAAYAYDATGTRVRTVRRKAPGRVEERIALGDVDVFRIRNGQGEVVLERQTLYVHDGDQRVALVETRTRLVGADPAPRQLWRFQLADHLGSVRLELTATAEIISYEEYHPYGTTAYCATRSATDVPKRFRFTGKERDEGTGFSYHEARYYVPWLGRWASCDPAGMVDGPNRYEYVACNPVRLVDDSGMDWVERNPGGTGIERSGPGTKDPEPLTPAEREQIRLNDVRRQADDDAELTVDSIVQAGHLNSIDYRDITKEVTGKSILSAVRVQAESGQVGLPAAPPDTSNVSFDVDHWAPKITLDQKLLDDPEYRRRYLERFDALQEQRNQPVAPAGVPGRPGTRPPPQRMVNKYGTPPPGTGQNHHINQNAAVESVVKRAKGASVRLPGNAFTEPGTPHYEFHKSLETFWEQFRTGQRAGTRPTVAEYSEASRRAFLAAGMPPDIAKFLSDLGRRELVLLNGMKPTDLMPRVPGRLNQRKP